MLMNRTEERQIKEEIETMLCDYSIVYGTEEQKEMDKKIICRFSFSGTIFKLFEEYAQKIDDVEISNLKSFVNYYVNRIFALDTI